MFALTYDEAKVLSDVISTARSGAGSQAAWEEMLRLLPELIPCDGLGIVFFDERTGKPVSRVIRNLDPAIYDAYERHFHDQDPITPKAREKGLFAFRPTDVMSRKAYESTEFCTDFQSRFGYQHPVTALIGSDGRPRAQIWLARESAKRAFSNRDTRILDLLRPHLAGGLPDEQAAVEAPPVWTALQPGLDRMMTPVLIVDHEFNLQHMNSAAVAVCEEAVCRAENALQRVLAAVGSAGADTGQLFLGDPRERGNCVIAGRKYALAVFPMSQPGQPASYVILLADVRERLRRTIVGSMRERGLSARETEVCQMLVNGMTDREIAEALCIAELTVKDHVKSIRRKLGVGSRAKVLPTLLMG